VEAPDERMIIVNGASKNKAVTAKITENEFKKLNELLKRTGLSRSTFIRTVLAIVMDYLEKTQCGSKDPEEAVEVLIKRINSICQ